MDKYWKQIEEKLISLNCIDEVGLASSATMQSINDLEKHIGVELPESVRNFLCIHNGQMKTTRVGLISGDLLLSVDGIRRCWDDWRGIDEKEMNEDCAEFMSSDPQGAIKPMYTNRKWIPLTHDISGNHIGLDYDPDVGGVVGQVIAFGRDEDTKRLLANNFEEFIRLYISLLAQAVWNGEYLDMPRA